MMWLSDALTGIWAQKWPTYRPITHHTLFKGIARTATRAYARSIEKSEERRTIKALEALNDSMLRDIGVHRGDIRHFAKAGADSSEQPGGSNST